MIVSMHDASADIIDRKLSSSNGDITCHSGGAVQPDVVDCTYTAYPLKQNVYITLVIIKPHFSRR